ncbi:hypothetical protein WQ57_23215 [Mesobacillus campisalis]|uniref:Uncharacterized protein n=1 Tax=Mesobacillus campisalis TaxID=1408103 RepID=A0A0M2SL03_9BACI|nr:hypothetical protein [Mesobacillus campisalis]KKK34336.1 hypothetical protein WQ57_23215 [Mesobacillus campisalis]
MYNRLLLIFTLVISFSFPFDAWADEGHGEEEDLKRAVETFRKGDVPENSEEKHMDSLHKEGHGDSHGTSSDEQSDSPTHEDGDGSHDEQGSHGHGEEIVEEGPNVKVLGIFGAINLSFLLIGVWNKWIRRKGE